MRRSVPRSIAFAAALAAFAVIVLIHDWFAPLPNIVFPTVQIGNGAAALMNTVPLSVPRPDPEIYDTISSRPIFSATRRPPPLLASSAIQTAGPPQMNLTLLGVVNAPGQRFGLVTVAGNASAVLVRPGSTVAGWTVVKINPSTIIVRSGETYEQLNFMP